MLIYIIVFITSCLFLLQGSKYKSKWNPFNCFGLFIPALFAGLRSRQVGSDTGMYQYMYTLVTDSSETFIEYLINDIEFFFYIFSNVGKFLGGNWFVFFSYQAISLICIFNVGWYFRKSVPLWLVFWIYFCLLFPYSLNIMRQITGVTFLLYGSLFLIKKEPKKFLLVAILSLGFHASAIIGAIFISIVFLFSSYKKNTRYLLFFVYIGLFVILFFLFLKITPLLGLLGIEKFSGYSENYGQINNASYFSITDISFRSTILIFIWFASLCKITEEKTTYLYSLLVIGEIGLMTLGLYNGFLFRMAMFFTAFHFILLPFLANSKRLTKKSRIILNTLISTMSLTYWWWVFVHNGTCGTIPYSSII